MTIHLLFDLLAATSAAAMTLFICHWRLAAAAERIENAGVGYAIALIAGAAVGGYGFGSLNLWLSGSPATARSVLGALCGAIAAIELYKRWTGIRGSTGLIFVPAFATSIAIGRWGCFFAGLEDETHGTPTALPWGHDFGDGITRHPVQLYESFAMTAFLAFALWALAVRQPFFMRNGFYLLTGCYAAQRFTWEFFKPYAAILGPFNLFHILCVALLGYSLVMTRALAKRPAT
jgi:prolipoprotein diacylglyceryltransferase